MELVETVFRALADPTRRALLDALFERDGQTLVALTARHDMTRIAVAKHPRLLEDAGLVVGRRSGRAETRIGAPDGESVRDLHPYDPGASLGGDHRPGDPRQVPVRCWHRVRLDAGLALPAEARRGGEPARRGGEPRRGAATPARADPAHVVERAGGARTDVPRDVGDRAGWRLLPAHGDS